MEINHLLVAYRGGGGDDELLRMGCRLVRELRGAKLSLVHVVEVPMSFALDATDAPGVELAEQVLEHCEGVGNEFGVSLNGETIPAREAGAVIVEAATNMGVDVVLVGTGEVHGSGGNQLRPTPEFVMQNASCAVLLGRFPRNGG